jgi:hypothetical protein
MVPFALLLRVTFFSKHSYPCMLVLALQLHSILDILNSELKEALKLGEEVMAGTPRSDNVNALKHQIEKLEARAKNEVQDIKTEETKIDEDTFAEEAANGADARLLKSISGFSGNFLKNDSMFGALFVDDLELVHFSDRFPQKVSF